MASEEIKILKFSEKTFEVIAKWSKNCDKPEDIERTSEYDIFCQYVVKPFEKFCYNLGMFVHPLLENENFSIEHSNSYILHNYSGNNFCLRAYFTTSKLFFIEITQWGINIGINQEPYQELIINLSRDNPQELINLFSINPNLISFKDYLHLNIKSIVHHEKPLNLLRNVAEHFEKYLPLIILKTGQNPIPFINHLYSPNNRDFDWEETGFTFEELICWLGAINRKGQAIIYGSPGTGKTFIAQRLAKELVGRYGFSELVQFHPAYTYEDFIQGIRPQSEDGKLTYPVVPGRFLEFCKKAEVLQDTCVLIIDEINRANLAQVFGELMYLLEYRDQEIPLAGGNRFRIPENVRIIGTMNTADRSIAQIDHALRRRFAFIELRPNYDVLIKYHLNTNLAVMDLINILKQLNQAINDKNYEIGISFFLTPNLREDIEDIWKMEIEPYLEEYFFNNLEKVDEFRWDKIEKQIRI